MAEVLRGPLPDALPFDFAAQVARHATIGAQADARFESNLMRTVLAVFGLSAAVVVAMYGHAWVAADPRRAQAGLGRGGELGACARRLRRRVLADRPGPQALAFAARRVNCAA